jgi:hypothetical protein
VIPPNWWIAALVLAAIVVGTVSVMRIDSTGERGSGLSSEFDYQIEEYEKVDPALILYDQTGQFATEMSEPRAVAAGPDDRIYVAGDQTLGIFDADGLPKSKIELGDSAYCLAVAGPEHAVKDRVYVGTKDRVLLLDAEGKSSGSWESLGPKAVLTSIALASEDVFVADAGHCVVLRYDTAGHVVGRIGEPDKARNVAGFAVPSPFFDVAVHPDGWLRVVNPGALRIEAFSFDGNRELYWGKASAAIDGFFGCCNPANIAILPDGRFVTAEKGLLRVKIYSSDGQFEGVVAGPEQLDSASAAVNESLADREHTAVDVAVDSRGRIIVLDRPGRIVRIFQRKALQTEAES